MSLQDDLDSIQASQTSIDEDITELTSGIDQIQGTVQNLLSQIPTAATTTEASALAVQASAEVGKLGPLVAALKQINTPAPVPDPNNPPPSV